MADTERNLAVNITATATWTQMTNGAAGSAYAVPTGGRALLASLTLMNLDSDSVVVEAAASINSTIADAERFIPPTTLLQYESVAFGDDGEREVLESTEGVWIRATGTTPNVTARGSVVEVTA